MIYRDRFTSCLSCGTALRHVSITDASYEKCVTCGAVWMEEGSFARLWNELRPINPMVFRPRTTGHKVRPCLTCHQPMDRVTVGHGVPVDRCAAHGIWFDAEELAVTLASAALGDEEWHQFFTDALRRMT